MNEIIYIDRKSGEKKRELVYHQKALHFLYKDSPFSKTLLHFLAKIPFFSFLVGSLQNMPTTRSKVIPFVKKYQIDTSEFEKKIDDFSSFNDFFVRKLKPGARPLHPSEAIIPADGRYLFYDNIESCEGFLVKGKKFSLHTLLQDETLAEKYQAASMAIARLCPTDYHRFHFPVSGTPGQPRLINGPLYSVNPLALKQNINYLSENKRMITLIKSDHFGDVLYIEIGATFVGSIHQTYNYNQHYEKGDEKGFFSFGGSSIILLFEQNKIKFDFDLLTNSSQYIETLCLMGDSLGKQKFS